MSAADAAATPSDGADDGLDPDAGDPSNPASAAAAQQTVANDAVAGETVTGVDGAIPVSREAAPTSDELAPANDGYLAPRNETGEDIDLDDDDQGRDSDVTVSHTDDAGSGT